MLFRFILFKNDNFQVHFFLQNFFFFFKAIFFKLYRSMKSYFIVMFKSILFFLFFFISIATFAQNVFPKIVQTWKWDAKTEFLFEEKILSDLNDQSLLVYEMQNNQKIEKEEISLIFKGSSCNAQLVIGGVYQNNENEIVVYQKVEDVDRMDLYHIKTKTYFRKITCRVNSENIWETKSQNITKLPKNVKNTVLERFNQAKNLY